MDNEYLNKLMNEREDLLDLREKTMEVLNVLSEKLDSINITIVNDQWIKENKIPWWKWTREKGFAVPEPKIKKDRKSKVVPGKLDDLIRIVQKQETKPLVEKEIKNSDAPKRIKPLEFTYYPDVMEEKAYRATR